MFPDRYYPVRMFNNRFFPVGGVVAPAPPTLVTEAHRFRSAIVPEFDDLDAVRRFLQRNQDEIARAVNPVRSVADGGTGTDT